ncbi:hypothetical protein [Rahnella variigena]|uniref:hypothetical protein n=1 Tax=Rahnella variigena TaxID=574964 RepID=UPI00101E0DC7|nr:hypothetical protein [Rahnella variigena]
MTKVYRDRKGDVINIGEWETLYSYTTGDDGEEVVTTCNPIPEGATVSDEDVYIGEDGGKYVVSNKPDQN